MTMATITMAISFMELQQPHPQRRTMTAWVGVSLAALLSWSARAPGGPGSPEALSGVGAGLLMCPSPRQQHICEVIGWYRWCALLVGYRVWFWLECVTIWCNWICEGWEMALCTMFWWLQGSLSVWSVLRFGAHDEQSQIWLDFGEVGRRSVLHYKVTVWDFFILFCKELYFGMVFFLFLGGGREVVGTWFAYSCRYKRISAELLLPPSSPPPPPQTVDI